MVLGVRTVQYLLFGCSRGVCTERLFQISIDLTYSGPRFRSKIVRSMSRCSKIFIKQYKILACCRSNDFSPNITLEWLKSIGVRSKSLIYSSFYKLQLDEKLNTDIDPRGLAHCGVKYVVSIDRKFINANTSAFRNYSHSQRFRKNRIRVTICCVNILFIFQIERNIKIHDVEPFKLVFLTKK